MRVVVQRVSSASVTIDGEVVGQIQQGFMILVGVMGEDTQADVDYLVKKVSQLRIFEDADGKTNLSLKDVGGSILSISQFTLYANTKKGNRPSFIHAADPSLAIPIYNQFNQALRDLDIHVETGEFGADMQVALVNDGPMTILIDSKNKDM